MEISSPLGRGRSSGRWGSQGGGGPLTSDGAGGSWWFEGLQAGRYALSIVYENTLASDIKTAGPALWTGKATTKEIAIEILQAPPASTQPARP